MMTRFFTTPSLMANRISVFWQRVSDGIEIQQLWGQFQADARASYKLYAGAGDWKQAEEESKWKRFWRVARGLFWAMSPGRRVVLLIALVLPGEFPISVSIEATSISTWGAWHFPAGSRSWCSSVWNWPIAWR